MTFTASLDEIISENANGLLGVRPGWGRTPLKEVASILNGFPFKSDRFTKGNGTPLLRIRDILRGSTETFYDGEFDPAFLVQAGDLVVGMDGDFNCGLWAGPPALLNQRVCKITVDGSRYSRRFLSYVLPGYLTAINAATPSLTVRHLSSRTVAAIPLPAPPLAEQLELADELDKQLTRLDAGVGALRLVQANLKRYRAAVLKAACEGCLVPTTKGARIQLTLPQFCSRAPNSIRRGPFGSAIRKEFFVSAGYKVYEQRNAICDDCSLGSYCISAEKFRELTAFEVRPNDLIISCSGTIGRVAIVPGWAEPGIINQALLKLTLDESVVLNRYFVIMFRNRVSELLRKATRGAAMQNIAGVSELKRLEWAVPSVEEQHYIVAEVERRLSLADDLDRIVTTNLHRATRLRRSILTAAFTGRLSGRHESSVSEALGLPHVAEGPRGYADESPVSS